MMPACKMTVCMMAVVDAPHIVAVVVGLALGALNYVASRRTTLAASHSQHAVVVMMAGFLARLALLAAVIFLVPRSVMHAPTFVITFLVAFLISTAFEARAVLRGARSAPLSRQPEIEGTR